METWVFLAIISGVIFVILLIGILIAPGFINNNNRQSNKTGNSYSSNSYLSNSNYANQKCNNNKRATNASTSINVKVNGTKNATSVGNAKNAVCSTNKPLKPNIRLYSLPPEVKHCDIPINRTSNVNVAVKNNKQ